MSIFYHGTSVLFREFDLKHVLEGDGKVKFGYGVYLTSSFKSAAHYSGATPGARAHYVYTVDIPEITVDNHIAFKEPVDPAIVRRAEEKFGSRIPDKATFDGKDFRKYIAKRMGGSDLYSEFLASEFLKSIGVLFITWPYNWRNPAMGINVAVLDDKEIRILKVEQVELDEKKQLIPGSEKEVAV